LFVEAFTSSEIQGENVMKRMINVVVLFAAALSVGSSVATAVEPVITKDEAKALIRTAQTPTDHEKLATFYRFEASQLQAEAKTHEEMGAEYSRNISGHPIPKYPTLGEHCKTLVKQLNAAAKSDLDLAGFHEGLAKNVQ
jgi:hypothetical protein